MTNKIENTTIEGINKNIRIIEGTQIFSDYHAEYYRNNEQNKKSYIVVHDDGDDKYIDCFLLNINIFDYYNGSNYKNNFSMDYLKEFGLFHHNGFLGVVYDENYAKKYLTDFFEKYGNCFIDDFEKYKSHNPENLKNRVVKLYDEIYKEVELLDNLGELFF